jgi:Tol biopolymer transport system component
MTAHSFRAALALLSLAAAAQQSQPSLSQPSLHPTRAEVVFVSGGDIWTAPLAGGEAQLLVSHPAQELRPLWSPDGKQLAFVSQRTGGGDIYVLDIATSNLRRLTFNDALENLDAWSPDSQWIYFHSSRQVQLTDIYRVRATGGTPLEVSADAMMTEFFAAPSPDGTQLAFSARGIAWNQWWRNGHSHLDESEIWRMNLSGAPSYERLVAKNGKNLWPMWGAAGQLFFVSDRTAAENLFTLEKGALRQLTQFRDGRLLFPAIGEKGSTIVFERNLAVWRYDVKSGKAAPLEIALRGAPALPTDARQPVTSFSSMEVSPDGKKLALISRGEVFVAASKEGDALPVTRTPAVESSLDWAPDSKRIAYLSDRNGNTQIFLYDFTTQAEKQLTSAALNDASPRFSPDGKTIAFVRNRKELRALTLETNQDRLLASAPINGPIEWSPDGAWIVCVLAGEKSFRNVHVVPVAGGEPKQVAFLSNVFTAQPLWARDGDALFFTTGQRTEGTRPARIALNLQAPKFREDQIRDLFKEEKKDEKKPPVKVEILFDDIRNRLDFPAGDFDASIAALSPDGKHLALLAETGGQENVWLWTLDELARTPRTPRVPRQLTTTPGSKSSVQFSPDSKEIWFLEAGRVNAINVESRQARSVNLSTDFEISFDREKLPVFRQAWGVMRDNFYDPAFHGKDWSAVKSAYEPFAAGARTPDELRRVISLMIGELNASHTGINAPSAGGPANDAVARLGLSFDRAEYESTGKLKISGVLPLSPAAVAKLQTGEYLQAVNGESAAAPVNLDALLRGLSTKRAVLSVSADAAGGNRRDVILRPISAATENELRYRHWVDGRRAYVDKVSQGQLGYVHMPDMSAESLKRLYVDLDSENHRRKGVVVDIRNNNGGFVNAYALDVFARRPYMTMTPRDFPSGPARTILGQRALELPTILVVNQFSLSDAEDFTEGYRTLKLGKIVGEPTAGWIIYTGSASLLDGSTVRTPSTRITGADGKVMELNPRPVDLPVERPVGETLTDRDSQLDTAVKELLAQIQREQQKR